MKETLKEIEKIADTIRSESDPPEDIGSTKYKAQIGEVAALALRVIREVQLRGLTKAEASEAQDYLKSKL